MISKRLQDADLELFRAGPQGCARASLHICPAQNLAEPDVCNSSIVVLILHTTADG